MSKRDLPVLWERHVLDSLQLIPLLPHEAAPALDLGSGAGFPGLILAIATGIHFHLVESDQRKCAFLREAAQTTDTTVTIHPTRIEALTHFPTAVITARALAPLPRLLALAEPFLTQATVCLFPVGRNTAAPTPGWSFAMDQEPSRTDPSSHILRLRQIARVAV